MSQYHDNLRVGQTRIYLGDTRWFVINHAEWIVKGPFNERAEAEAALERLREKQREEEASLCPECGRPYEDTFWAMGCTCESDYKRNVFEALEKPYPQSPLASRKAPGPEYGPPLAPHESDLAEDA